MSDEVTVGVFVASTVATIIAALGLVIASRALKEARRSAEAAERSASASETAASAAQDSLSLQRYEVAAAAEDRSRALKTNLVPLYWEGRNGRGAKGLNLKNTGPSAALNIRAVLSMGGPPDVRTWAGLGSGDEVGLLGVAEEPVGDEAEGAVPPRTGYVNAKVAWTNQDGTRDSTDWQEVPNNR